MLVAETTADEINQGAWEKKKILLNASAYV